MKKLTVMIIGSGAREHAIAKSYERSTKIDKIIVTPGNDFILVDKTKDIIIEKNTILTDPKSFLEIANKYSPNIIEVAQDDAIASGTVNLLQKNGFRVFGPTKEAGRIEWDKVYSRDFMIKYGIPSPKYQVFSNQEKAIEYVKNHFAVNPNQALYIKASGLCGGKGALKAVTYQEACRNIKKMKDFGKAGKEFLIEQGLVGEEFSIFAITDGENYKILKSSQDNKRLLDNDEGPQTGGMGATSPAMVTKGLEEKIEHQFIAPLIDGMRKEKTPYVGIIYFSGMLVGENIFTIEYNSRWGDPECQVVLPSIQNDYVDIVQACLSGELDKIEINQDTKSRICVVGASKGYPKDYSGAIGKEIVGLDKSTLHNVELYGAGIQVKNNRYYTNGGRLFSLVGYGQDILEAKKHVYTALQSIKIEGDNLHYRTDIGFRDLVR
ncbi:MAG: phosphoribosylamine--glycine ligase [Candidatus Kariarchaeaceae archaeon]|jgi:phosphoribosylamine--glycine ligase